MDKCPHCGGKADDCSEILIEEVKDTTILLVCHNCELLWGRYT